MSDTEHDALPDAREPARAASFVNALDFVDEEIDKTEIICNLSVEALVTLAILRIVRSPRDVRVNITRAQRMVVMEFDVRTEDIGQVIGKGGHTIDAIRSLSKSAAGSADIEYVIYLLEDGSSPSSSFASPSNATGRRFQFSRGAPRRRR